MSIQVSLVLILNCRKLQVAACYMVCSCCMEGTDDVLYVYVGSQGHRSGTYVTVPCSVPVKLKQIKWTLPTSDHSFLPPFTILIWSPPSISLDLNCHTQQAQYLYYFICIYFLHSAWALQCHFHQCKCAQCPKHSTNIPYLENPSSVQTTEASILFHPKSHTVLKLLSTQTSTLPWLSVSLMSTVCVLSLTNRTYPLSHETTKNNHNE